MSEGPGSVPTFKHDLGGATHECKNAASDHAALAARLKNKKSFDLYPKPYARDYVEETRLLLKGKIMTQINAVVAAITHQLIVEGHSPDNQDKIMGKDFHYDINTISNFLRAVRMRLLKGTPAFYFSFEADLASKALNLNFTGLVRAFLVRKDASFAHLTAPAHF
ncbi:hypothetical protein [Undibacterium terreum]|uniref:Uncharacterized protein n=1 Tax=Undibacterium terreum TaxID=1224302 RepID=A0A916UKD9_9BURK|nr:hypothetical protein [Undibacterium terreum]GGC75260.1 hypothetical protein GCM10011396_23100 [Undibacterium terreum]